MTTNLTGIIHKRKDLALKDEMMDQIKRQVVSGNNGRTAPAPARQIAQVADASTLTVLCAPEQYSASSIAHAVEDCNAHLLNLNITDGRTSDGRLMVDIRVNHRNPASVIRSLERYGYEVAGILEPLSDAETEQMRERINELMHYLNI